ncbi:hypothetical protein [Lichenicola sp.]|uniref:hypothetical protein n=1 Tax=Lichenicola sp. TaxID=2804529 RepID=UPI003AFF976B
MRDAVTNPPNFQVPEKGPLPDDGGQSSDHPRQTLPAPDTGPEVLRKGHENPP